MQQCGGDCSERGGTEGSDGTRGGAVEPRAPPPPPPFCALGAIGGRPAGSGDGDVPRRGPLPGQRSSGTRCDEEGGGAERLAVGGWRLAAAAGDTAMALRALLPRALLPKPPPPSSVFIADAEAFCCRGTRLPALALPRAAAIDEQNEDGGGGWREGALEVERPPRGDAARGVLPVPPPSPPPSPSLAPPAEVAAAAVVWSPLVTKLFQAVRGGRSGLVGGPGDIRRMRGELCERELSDCARARWPPRADSWQRCRSRAACTLDTSGRSKLLSAPRALSGRLRATGAADTLASGTEIVWAHQSRRPFAFSTINAVKLVAVASGSMDHH